MAVSDTELVAHNGRSRSLAPFLTVQIVLLVALLAGAAYRVQHFRQERSLPRLRSAPRMINPTYDYPVVASDEQLERVLHKLRPRDLGDRTKINHVDHALRFWGLGCNFEKGFLPGEKMRELLVDHRLFARVYGSEEPSLLIDVPRTAGVRLRTQQGRLTSSHYDHTMACLAEVGTPLDFPVHTPAGAKQFRDMVEQALRDFSLNQFEYEWSALTFALYLESNQPWMSKEGQWIDFDRIADRLMREEAPLGVCYGNHRLYTLTAFLRVDDSTPILTPEKRQEILDYLHAMTVQLVKTQHSTGFWNGEWADRRPESPTPRDREGDRIADRILATGHALEWWALAPEELHPPRPTLAAGGQWLVRTIDELSEDDTQQLYTYLTHAGRSLLIWRGRDWPTSAP
ncbi:MAG: hypothetical protein KDA42_01055 [Planctomycetales bacterium]|nr:hypothetical protein [Planctomycetales bacterium]